MLGLFLAQAKANLLGLRLTHSSQHKHLVADVPVEQKLRKGGIKHYRTSGSGAVFKGRPERVRKEKIVEKSLLPAKETH